MHSQTCMVPRAKGKSDVHDDDDDERVESQELQMASRKPAHK